MPSRQDQLQSYQFSVQRVVAALVTHDSDPAQSPFRRSVAATMGGVLVAVIALAGAVVFALLGGGDTKKWQDDTTVFIENDTGAKYVYVKEDGQLHPMLNFASALLVANATARTHKPISRKSVANANLGPQLGIPGAPDSLPTRGDLVTEPWTLCSQRDTGTTTATSLLTVGGNATGGQLLTVPKQGSADALLISTSSTRQYLVYNNYRHRILQPQTALTALNASGQQPIRVAAALANALPAGVDVRPLTIANRGQPSTALRGVKIGQIYTAAAPGGLHEYAVAFADGVTDISEVQANLLLADPQTAAAVGQQTITVNTAQYSALPRSKVVLSGQTGDAALPATTPNLIGTAQSVCVTVPNAADRVTRVVVDAAAPVNANVVTTASSTAAGTVLADRIAVPRGHGVLVGAVASPDAPADSDALSLVTDAGLRYPVADRDILAKLGYAGVTPVRMPAELVAMVPAGPPLDPAAARARA
jgi:type VII secretion protein EccB